MLTGWEQLQRAYDYEADADSARESAGDVADFVALEQIQLARAQLHATYALIAATLDSKPGDEPISEGWYDVTSWG